MAFRARWRKFADVGAQAVYDRLRTTKPGEEVQAQGAIGNGYWVGRYRPNPRRPFAVRGSLAYAGWCAGIDVAREDRGGPL